MQCAVQTVPCLVEAVIIKWQEKKMKQGDQQGSDWATESGELFQEGVCLRCLLKSPEILGFTTNRCCSLEEPVGFPPSPQVHAAPPAADAALPGSAGHAGNYRALVSDLGLISVNVYLSLVCHYPLWDPLSVATSSTVTHHL